MRRSAGFLFIASALLFGGGGTIFGAEATYILAGGLRAVEHSVNGFSQSIRSIADGGAMVQISVSESPVGTRGGWEPVWVGEGVPGRAGFDLPLSLGSRLQPGQDAYTRATEILRWVDGNLDIDTGDQGPQDALSVLRRGVGRCSGLANAAAGLLMTAGFRARTVSGLLVSDDGVVPHRWVECRLPGAGWVPTDPTLGFWVVTPRHIVFSDTVLEPPQVRVVVEAPELGVLPILDGRPIRPDRGAELVCRVIGTSERQIVAVLRGGSGEERRTVLGPEGRFSGLFPGRWFFELEVSGRIVQRRVLDLGPGSTHSLAVDLDQIGNL
ncbi:MAG: transglutaminase-like domain-containing protein [Thermoanaerobaculales bacterium]|nr:transglutaminase-like domain-containing protein [Thermoanaerobaculales bacterium]